MSPLVKIRSERDQMSAVERRIADFMLENAQLLRDYSSQRLASALGISQSSVVKFSQKLGFRGYPDLKYSLGEAIARTEQGAATAVAAPKNGDPHAAQIGELWRRKSEAEEATRLINPAGTLRAAAEAIGKAKRVFLIGLGDDDIHARAFALKLAMLGILAVQSADLVQMTANASAAGIGDALLVFSEFGSLPPLCQIGRDFRERGSRLITVTRHTANTLRTLADIPLLVSAHAEPAYLEPMLYQSALQHLLDGIFIRLCEGDAKRRAQLLANNERIRINLDL